jgi:N-ethylmaleimide reductase
MKLSRREVTKGALGSVLALALRGAGGAEARSDNAQDQLFSATRMRELQLANRLVMAPLTRGRAGPQRTANALMAEYYEQRASAGLIISEATAISAQGYGWGGSPGIYIDAHVAGWQGVTEAVHRRGSKMFLQLWHMGRVSHPDFLEGGTPVGPSALRPTGMSFTPTGQKPYVTPHAMTAQEIASTVNDYAQATRRAREAGFDGVEIHAANGYLIDQFLRDGSNQRTDAYGGSIEKRQRFMLEVVEAAARTWSADRIGVRLSPNNDFNDMRDSQPAQTFALAARALNRFGLAYLHIVEPLSAEATAKPQTRIHPRLRAAFDGFVILNGNYDASSGAAALQAREADLIAYGRPFLANPDLVVRYRRGAALNKLDVSTFYTDGPKGYTDYPRLES